MRIRCSLAATGAAITIDVSPVGPVDPRPPGLQVRPVAVRDLQREALASGVSGSRRALE